MTLQVDSRQVFVALVLAATVVTGCNLIDPDGDDANPALDPGGQNTDPEGAGEGIVFVERDGLVAIEAEHFFEDDSADKPRAWTKTGEYTVPDITPDPDPPHVDGASGGLYLESLPDTRVTHDDPFEPGALYNTPGQGPTLSYRVDFVTPGRYYVWVRAFSTGTEDNGIHVGIDDDWPDSGKRIQWCAGKNRWTWSNAQRDACGTACGCPGTIWIEVEEPGEHVIRFAQREDGFEFDKFVLTTDAEYVPNGVGPDELRR